MHWISAYMTFKIHLKCIYSKIDCYKPYLTGHLTGHIHLSRIRMNLSGLNYHRFRHHFINHSSCPNCDSTKEDPEHFFLICPAYTALCSELETKLEQLLPHHTQLTQNPLRKKHRKEILKFFIFGTKNQEIDKQVFNNIALFIEKTGRFNHALS